MDRLLYNDDAGAFMLADDVYLRRLRALSEAPSDDDDFVAELDELERAGWRPATSLTIAMVLGEVHDEASLAAWAGDPPPPNPPAADRMADALERLTDAMSSKATPRIESPYLTKEEAALYMRTTVDGVYGRVERGRLKSCPGVREYLFTREMLDDSMMGRVEKPKAKGRGRS